MLLFSSKRMLWEKINCKATWLYEKQTIRVASTESVCPVFIQTPDLKFKHRIWKLPQTGIILTASCLLSFCTRSATPVLAPFFLLYFKWCLSPWSGMLPSVPAFQTLPAQGAVGSVALRQSMDFIQRKSGYSVLKKWGKWQNNGLLCGGIWGWYVSLFSHGNLHAGRALLP